ncbi:hypothetical protein [Streptomyces pinistramenti]|uniref:hypothetical protein n=1 Tax=Streptomyces pinistramenti TaxID=2884812 RepID=UPI001D093630|nr:hypothetical protein [Streptomyces pinistramenti]MCB5909681.1 hypothetical protein [Streptomyces pinistramenti]
MEQCRGRAARCASGFDGRAGLPGQRVGVQAGLQPPAAQYAQQLGLAHLAQLPVELHPVRRRQRLGHGILRAWQRR